MRLGLSHGMPHGPLDGQHGVRRKGAPAMRIIALQGPPQPNPASLDRFQVGQRAQPLTVDNPVHQLLMAGHVPVQFTCAILIHGDSSFPGQCPCVVSIPGRIALLLPKTQMRADAGAHSQHVLWGWKPLPYGVAVALSIRCASPHRVLGGRAPCCMFRH